MKGHVASILQKFLNSKKLGPFGGYLAIVLGAALTILVQSSSVFTSAITPLVGTGFLELELMYPLTLGANIGTCVTGVLAALAADSRTLDSAMQTAMIHLFFNITGILIWYPLPLMRYVPVKTAKLLGKTSSRYRWFPIVYITTMFLFFPLLIFGLSLVNFYLPVVFVAVIAVILIVIAIIKIIQRKRPNWLPVKLQNWKWLPLPLRSLEPYDRVCCFCCRKTERCAYKEDDGNREIQGSDVVIACHDSKSPLDEGVGENINNYETRM